MGVQPRSGTNPRAPPHPFPALAWASRAPPPGRGLGACAVWGRSRVGVRPPRPRPLSRRWEREQWWQGVPAGDAPGRGCRRGHHPRPQVPWVNRPVPRAHPPARGIGPGDRRRRRRPCPAPGSVCKVSQGEEGSAHPARTGGAAGAASLEAGGRDASPRPVRQLLCLRESPAPDEACRLRRRQRPHLSDSPFQHPHIPARRAARAGSVTKFPIPQEPTAPGVPGWMATR